MVTAIPNGDQRRINLPSVISAVPANSQPRTSTGFGFQVEEELKGGVVICRSEDISNEEIPFGGKAGEMRADGTSCSGRWYLIIS